MNNVNGSSNPDNLPLQLPETAAYLIKSYQQAQQSSEELMQDLSLLRNDQALGEVDKVDFEALALFAGGTFTQPTPLNNGETSIGFNFFNQYFTSLCGSQKSNPEAYKDYKFNSKWETIHNFQKELKFCHDIDDNIRNIVEGGKYETKQNQAILINNAALKLQNEFKKKKVNWFPISWTDRDGGHHTILLRLDRKNGTVTIVNSGKGIESYHPKISETTIDKFTGKPKTEEKYQEFVTISGVNLKRMKHQDFFRYLVKLQTQLGWEGQGSAITIENIYESLPSYLEGKIDSGISPIDHPELFKKAEACSSGSFKPLSTMFYYMMCGVFDDPGSIKNVDGYKELIYIMKRDALVNYVKNVQSGMEIISPEQFKLLNDMIEKLSRKASKIYKSANSIAESAINEEKLVLLRATLEDIKQNLKVKKAQSQAAANTVAKSCQLDSAVPAQLDGVIFQIPKTNNQAIDRRVVNMNAAQNLPLDDVLIPLAEFSFPENYNLETIDDCLDTFRRAIIRYNTIRHVPKDMKLTFYQVVRDKFAGFICSLPDASKKDASFWSNIPEHEILQYMARMKNLMTLVKHIHDLCPQQDENAWNADRPVKEHEADITVMLYALHAINFQLASKLSENKLVGGGFDPYHQDLFAEIRSPSFVLQSSQLQKKLKKILNFFDPTFTLEKQVTGNLSDMKKKIKNSVFDFRVESRVKASDVDSNPTLKFLKQFVSSISPESTFGKKFYDKVIGGKITVEVERTRQVPVYDNRGRQRFDDITNLPIMRTETYKVDEEREIRPSDTLLQHLEALINDRRRGTPEGFLPLGVCMLMESSGSCYTHHNSSRNNKFRQDSIRLTATVAGKEPDQRLNYDIDFDNYSRNYDDISIVCDTNLKKHKASEQNQRYYWRREKDTSDLYADLRKMTKQNQYIPGDKGMLDLMLDSTRDLEMIGVDPYGAVARLISFCNNNLNVLEKPGMLDFIRLQLFRNGQLTSQLENQIDIVVDLLFFVEKAIGHYQSYGKLDMCLKLAKLGNDIDLFICDGGFDLDSEENSEKIQNRIEELRKDKYKHKIDNELPDFRKILRENLMKEIDKKADDEKWHAKCEIYKTLLTFYEKIDFQEMEYSPELKEEAAIDMLSLLIANNMNNSPAQDGQLVSSFKTRFKTLLTEGIKTGNIDAKIFNSVIKVLEPNFDEESVWSENGSVFSNGDYSIDIEEGSVTRPSYIYSKTPSRILNNEDFKKIFKGKIVSTLRNDKSGSSYIINKDKPNELIVTSTTDWETLSFEKKIKGQTHRYINYPDHLRNIAPTLFKENLICWLCEDVGQNDKPFISVRDQKDKEVFKVILRKQGAPFANNQDFQVESILKLNSQQQELQWVPSDCVASLRDQDLLNFDVKVGHFNVERRGHSEFMECWVNLLTQELAEINCLELGLNFVAQKVNGCPPRLGCREFPGYFLVNNPSVAIFEGLKFFTLMNADGDQKVLVPCKKLGAILQGKEMARLVGQYDQLQGGNLPMLEFDPEHPMTWFDFDLKEEGLTTQNVEGRISLIGFLIARGDYQAAFDLLNKTDSLTRFEDNPETSSEAKAIQGLLLLLGLDQHPAAQAMLLQLIVKLEENRLKFPLSKDVKGDVPEERPPLWNVLGDNLEGQGLPGGVFVWILYENYTKNKASNATIYKLTEDQEQRIATIIKKDIEKNAAESNDMSQTAIYTGFKFYLWQHDRFNYLKEGITKLGAKIQFDLFSFSKSVMDAATQFSQPDVIRDLIDKVQTTDLSEKLDLNNEKMILENRDLREKFFEYYQIARLGSISEREQLSRLLSLNAHLGTFSEYWTILEKVCKDPSSYPTIDDLKISIVDVQEADNNKDLFVGKYDVKARILRTAEQDLDTEEWALRNAKYRERDNREATFELYEKRIAEAKKVRDLANEKCERAEKKKNDAIAEHERLKSHRDSLFDKLTPGMLDRAIKLIQFVWKNVSKYILNNFSLGTNISDMFYRVFKTRYVRPEIAEMTKTPLACEDEVIAKTDAAFNIYLGSLRDQYFDCKTEAAPEYVTVLPSVENDANLNKKIAEENEDLEAYRKSLPKEIKTFYEKSTVQLKDLREGLESTLKALSGQQKTLKTALLWQINQVPDDAESNGIKAINQIGMNQKLNWDDIRKLTLDGSLEVFQAKTHLSEEEAKRFMINVSDYLIRATRLEQMKIIIRAVAKAESTSKAISKPENHDKIGVLEAKKKMLIQNIVAALETVRFKNDENGQIEVDAETNEQKILTYKPSTNNIHLQWFEVGNNLMYRGNQIAKLKEIIDCEDAEILAEMPTGWGKTKTAIPTLNFIKSVEGWLVVNTWPASLELQNASDVKGQAEKSFGLKVDRFTFDRSTNINVESLQFMYESLVKDRKEGCSLNIRAETLRSFELHFIEALDRARRGEGGNVEELKKQIEYFIKILREIRCNGWSVIDESHYTLDPKDKLIYTTGKGVTLPARHMELLEKMFIQMVKDPIKGLVDICGNKQADVLANDHNGKIYNQIADHLVDYFAKEYKISDENFVSFRNFVLGLDGNIPEWLENMDVNVKGDIALIKGELSIVLKSSLKGSTNENFGLSRLHIDAKEYAISYAYSMTPKETPSNPSQFKNPHETMNKTYMTYLTEGLSLKQAKKLINALREVADADQELSRRGGSLSAKEKARLLRKRDGSDTNDATNLFHKILPDYTGTLKTILDEEIEAYYEKYIKNNHDAIFYYIRKVVAEQFKTHPKILVSTAHNFRSQFATSLSLSATPQDKKTHGPDTHFIPMKGTSGKVTHILLTQNMDPSTLYPFKADNKDDAQKEALDIINGNVRIKATIDIGAHFKGASNFEIAQNMRKELKNDGVKAIIFFDEEAGLFTMMDPVTGHCQARSGCQTDPEDNFATFDQARCTGSDEKFSMDAIGLALTDKKTNKDKVGQGCGRMRGWGAGQENIIAYPESLKADILDPIHQRDNLNLLLDYVQAKNSDEKPQANGDIEAALQAISHLFDSNDQVQNIEKLLGYLESGRLDNVDKNALQGILLELKDQYVFAGDEVEREEDVLTILDLMNHWLKNQTRMNEDSNYHSQGQQMENEIRRVVLDKILGLEIGKPPQDAELSEDVDVDAAIRLSGDFEKVFFSDETNDPWKMYASIPEDQDPIPALKRQHTHCMQTVDALGGLTREEKEVIYGRLENYPNLWNEMVLPKKVKVAASGIGMECEVLQETEVNEEQEIQEQRQEEIYEREPAKWPEKMDLFSDNWVQPQENGAFMLKLAGGLSNLNKMLIGGETNEILRHVYNASYIVGGFGVGCAIGGMIVSAAAISTFAVPVILGVGALVAAAMLVVNYGAPLINHLVLPQNPIFKMSDLVSIHSKPGQTDGSKFFDSKFMASNNFFVQKPQGAFEMAQAPFTLEQKPMFDLLVIQDENENGIKDIKVMAIDQNDSVYFHEKLQKDKEADGDISARKRKVAIYDVRNERIIDQGRNEFTKEELATESFKGLVTQAKLVGGEVKFSSEELDMITSRARQGEMLNVVAAMVEKEILPNRGLNRLFFVGSPLQKALQGTL